MPLFEKARIEVYIPDLPQQSYQNLRDALTQEFTYTFGGSTIMPGLDGSYLSRYGLRVQDRVHLLYTDTPFAFEENFESLSRYADALKMQRLRRGNRKRFWSLLSRCIILSDFVAGPSVVPESLA